MENGSLEAENAIIWGMLIKRGSTRRIVWILIGEPAVGTGKDVFEFTPSTDYG